MAVCSTTPRFSYEGPETPVQHVGHCSNGHVRVRVRVPGRVYRVGTRVGIPGGYRGVLPTQHAARGDLLMTAKRAPEAPGGAGVGGHEEVGRTRGRRRYQDHPSGPVGALQAPPCPGP